MPSGACVIAYDGERGRVWWIKFRDAAGKQVKERVGSAKEGKRRKDAEALLRRRLTQVEDGYKKGEPTTFAAFAARFQAEHLPARGLATSTLVDYRLTIERHLLPAFGAVDLAELERRPEMVERYVASKLAAQPDGRPGLSPKTVRNHLTLLGRMFRVAKMWRLVRDNPVELVDPPRAEESEVELLLPGEIAGLLAAFRELEAEEEDEAERAWWGVARRAVTVAVGTGLRRGEVLGLSWRGVELLAGAARVSQAYVRGEMKAPKSRAGRRTVRFDPQGPVGRALSEQWEASRYRADDDLCFGHPALGTPLDPSKLTRVYVKAALARAGIETPFRPWHGLRHTGLTYDAAANGKEHTQARAGHAQVSMTERYVHMAALIEGAVDVVFPEAAKRSEKLVFSAVEGPGTESGTTPDSDEEPSNDETPPERGISELPGLDSNQQPSG
jgi:integrase